MLLVERRWLLAAITFFFMNGHCSTIVEAEVLAYAGCDTFRLRYGFAIADSREEARSKALQNCIFLGARYGRKASRECCRIIFDSYEYDSKCFALATDYNRARRKPGMPGRLFGVGGGSTEAEAFGNAVSDCERQVDSGIGCVNKHAWCR